jgi:voltage-gated sodium channel
MTTEKNFKNRSKFVQSIHRISQSNWFSNLTVLIIIFYAGILGFKTLDEVENEFIFIIDYAVTIYFVIEIFIRITAHENKLDFFKNPWNLFDFVIVLITTIPFDQSNLVAIARVMRVFRVLRVLTVRPELRKIIDMLINSIPSIIDIVLLMFIIFYIYAVIGSFLFADMKSGLFENFLTAMLTLFRVLTFEDWTDVMYEAMEIHQWSWFYFVSFIVITAFVFFNLFVAVIIGEMESLREDDKKENISDKTNNLEQKISELQAENKKIISMLESIQKKV